MSKKNSGMFISPCWRVSRVKSSFELPALDELQSAGVQERMNVFRRFFASSRYNRLLIQQKLVRSAIDKSLASEVVQLEQAHNEAFGQMLVKVKQYGFLEEFLAAVREEDNALQKIIEAYDKRMYGRT
jgi:hypothetical protein